mmetsp:Transcript_35842/g.61122  ORF Transcript_35842/g.61122 Transcript_35842/m.61122 type:complete len:233 (-) Transcript_35842:115-813(-)|eukprot:CAMPEP_0183730456 /NCGR_PEP_ID=MMETSP0737-20130205/32895_1 /TAXON_ID=385413 /ORGANISM="Thalassiosira miniscula, Strain CCMP1093" /LENGTH=232 /DNA_ID=CAMNT_0025962961 /DNA_START=141 /DNA_END=839 /DNA_ORIENTATION=-
MGINEYLESRDVSSSDVAPFLLIHTILSAALVGSTWWWCYLGSGRTPPTQLFKNEQMPQSVLLNLLVSVPIIPDGIKRWASRSLLALEQASRNSKPVKYLEQKMPSLDATRVCVSYAEAKFGRLFFKPITVPGRIWLSWKGTKALKQMQIQASGRSYDSGDDEAITAKAKAKSKPAFLNCFAGRENHETNVIGYSKSKRSSVTRNAGQGLHMNQSSCKIRKSFALSHPSSLL